MFLKITHVVLILLAINIIKGQIEETTETTTTEESISTTSTTPSTTVQTRTLPYIVQLEWRCDGLAIFCMRAYQTGRVCARTIYYNYVTFKNYCMMDFVNCNEQFEVWQIVHMGECYKYIPTDENLSYNYHTDSFLDEYYVVEPMGTVSGTPVFDF